MSATLMDQYKLIFKKDREYHLSHNLVRDEQAQYMMEKGYLIVADKKRELSEPYDVLKERDPVLSEFDRKKRIGEERIERNREDYHRLIAQVDIVLHDRGKAAGPLSGDARLDALCILELNKLGRARGLGEVTRKNYRKMRELFAKRTVAETVLRAKIRYADSLLSSEYAREMRTADKSMRGNGNDFAARLG